MRGPTLCKRFYSGRMEFDFNSLWNLTTPEGKCLQDPSTIGCVVAHYNVKEASPHIIEHGSKQLQETKSDGETNKNLKRKEMILHLHNIKGGSGSFLFSFYHFQ